MPFTGGSICGKAFRQFARRSVGKIRVDPTLPIFQSAWGMSRKRYGSLRRERQDRRLSLRGGEIRNVDMASHSSKIRVDSGIIRNVTIQEPWLVAENRARTQEVELQSSLPADAGLQPGNTVVFTMVIQAKNAIMMSPSKFRLQFSVNYNFPAVDTTTVHTNTISQEISIRAPVYSVMLGAVIGGFFGSLARVLAPATPSATTISPAISVLLSVILGAAAVVFLARKSDAQAFVSVEDIWGGALIGFLVGYSGTSFFDQLAKITH
jgi:hypothetical protein